MDGVFACCDAPAPVLSEAKEGFTARCVGCGRALNQPTLHALTDCVHVEWIEGRCAACGVFVCCAEIDPGVRPEAYCDRFAVRVVHGDPLCGVHASTQE